QFNVRCKNEDIHGEFKQLTGIVSCQCRKGRIQRNHIDCAILVWLRLKYLAYKTGQTNYQIKHGLLSYYLVQQLKSPDFPMFIVYLLGARRGYTAPLLVTVA
nr:hypothetical protein [Nostoc sp. DedQUE02]